jgi:putative DNA primase/helicase
MTKPTNGGADPAASLPVPAIQGPGRPVPIKLDPAGFPHPPKTGTHYLPTTIENTEHLLDECGFAPRFNVIKKKLEIRRADGAPATMNEIISLASLHGLSTGLIQAFVEEVGHRRPHNPVKEWIRSIPWDGADRLAAFYQTVTTRQDYPDNLKTSLLYRWLLSVVASAIVGTGFHTRGVLTLQGPQGIGKTRWVAALVPAGIKRHAWVKLDHHMDGANKDSIIGAITHWITEIGELDSSFKKDVARLKGFLTNDCDKLRRPYGREESEYPRRTVFVATVNEDTFLVDPTGNNRWFTVAVDRLDYNHGIDMQQLFAQLAKDVDDGTQWWLDDDEEKRLAAYNVRHRSVSAIAERVREYIGTNHPADRFRTKTALEVLREVGIQNPTNAQCKECGSVLRELLGEPRRVRGRDKWRIPVTSRAVTSLDDDDDEY